MINHVQQNLASALKQSGNIKWHKLVNVPITTMRWLLGQMCYPQYRLLTPPTPANDSERIAFKESVLNLKVLVVEQAGAAGVEVV